MMSSSYSLNSSPIPACWNQFSFSHSKPPWNQDSGWSDFVSWFPLLKRLWIILKPKAFQSRLDWLLKSVWGLCLLGSANRNCSCLCLELESFVRKVLHTYCRWKWPTLKDFPKCSCVMFLTMLFVLAQGAKWVSWERLSQEFHIENLSPHKYLKKQFLPWDVCCCFVLINIWLNHEVK